MAATASSVPSTSSMPVGVELYLNLDWKELGVHAAAAASTRDDSEADHRVYSLRF
jgi:hypothetical protein